MNLVTHVNKPRTYSSFVTAAAVDTRPRPSSRTPIGLPDTPIVVRLGHFQRNGTQRNSTQRNVQPANWRRFHARRSDVFSGTRLTGARGSCGDVPAADTRRLYTDRQSMDRLQEPGLAVNKQDEIEPFSSPPSAVSRDKEVLTHGAPLNSTLGRSQSNRPRLRRISAGVH